MQCSQNKKEKLQNKTNYYSEISQSNEIKYEDNLNQGSLLDKKLNQKQSLIMFKKIHEMAFNSANSSIYSCTDPHM